MPIYASLVKSTQSWRKRQTVQEEPFLPNVCMSLGSEMLATDMSASISETEFIIFSAILRKSYC